MLHKNGFAVKEQYGYGSEFGLKLRWPALGRLFKVFPHAAVAVRVALDATPFYVYLAQMRLYVARKHKKEVFCLSG
jgi:hypothetical protein